MTGGKEYPAGDLIFKVVENFPNWNLNYWFFGVGEPILKEGVKQSKAELDDKSKLQEEEFKELLKLRGIQEAYEKLLDKLPEIMKNQK